jgi:hypothetical protein
MAASLLLVCCGVAALALDHGLRHDGFEEGHGGIIFTIIGVCLAVASWQIWTLARAHRDSRGELSVMATADGTIVMVQQRHGQHKIAALKTWTVWESKLKTGSGSETRMLNVLLIDADKHWLGFRSLASDNAMPDAWQYHPESLKNAPQVFTARAFTDLIRLLQQRHPDLFQQYYFVKPYGEMLEM